MQNLMGNFQLENCVLRYSTFVPRFYNLCKSYGFKPGRIMPSRAFCSDESQGFPVILITKHFGAFPFNHGMVGSIVATDRHGPHAHHGRDLVIIQASHVGYDPETANFGMYRRLQTDPQVGTPSCGKISSVLGWYQQEYHFAAANVFTTVLHGQAVVIIDNQFLDSDRDQGLFLDLENLIDTRKKIIPEPLRVLSTSKIFRAQPKLIERLPETSWTAGARVPIGDLLTADLFNYKRPISNTLEGRDQLEYNLSRHMPWIVTAKFPALNAAMANTQIEFDRTFRTLIREPEYQQKNLAFIAGLNIDISPKEGQMFPLTKFIPWAAYIQTETGKQFTLEQNELVEALSAQSSENPERIELSKAIHIMEMTPAVDVKFPK